MIHTVLDQKIMSSLQADGHLMGHPRIFLRDVRVPFLDPFLVHFALSLPSEYKLRGGFNKRVNREGVKGIVPEKIRWRRDKQGYSSPISVWDGREIKSFFSQALTEAASLPFVKKEMVLSNFQRYLAGQKDFDPFWWRLVSVDRWIKLFQMG